MRRSMDLMICIGKRQLKWSFKSWKRRQNNELCYIVQISYSIVHKITFFWGVRAEILLLCAEKSPFLGFVQKYYWPGARGSWILVQGHFWGPWRNIGFSEKYSPLEHCEAYYLLVDVDCQTCWCLLLIKRTPKHLAKLSWLSYRMSCIEIWLSLDVHCHTFLIVGSSRHVLSELMTGG